MTEVSIELTPAQYDLMKRVLEQLFIDHQVVGPLWPGEATLKFSKVTLTLDDAAKVQGRLYASSGAFIVSNALTDKLQYVITEAKANEMRANKTR